MGDSEAKTSGCCGKTSLILKLSALLLVIVLALQMIGFSVPFWSQRQNSNEGLWEICQGGICASSSTSPVISSESWYQAVQAFMVLSVIFGVVAVILVLTILFAARFACSRVMFAIAIAFTAATGFFILIAVVIYGVRGSVFLEGFFLEPFVVGFAYILTIISLFGYFAVALLLALDLMLSYHRPGPGDNSKPSSDVGTRVISPPVSITEKVPTVPVPVTVPSHVISSPHIPSIIP